MKYITGIHALNINCELETCGDWHASALKWENIFFMDSEKMFFNDYGIAADVFVPALNKKFYVANHIRALLDLLEIGNFAVAQGMNNDFICNSKYDEEVFEKVYAMRKLNNWQDIDKFMCKEYLMKWIKYKETMELDAVEIGGCC